MVSQEDHYKLEDLQEKAQSLFKTIQSRAEDFEGGEEETQQLVNLVDEINLLQDKIQTEEEAEQKSYRELRSHRAFLSLPEEAIHKMLSLPDDVFVAGVSYDAKVQSFQIHVFGERFEKVEEASESLYVQSNVRLEECEHGSYHLYFDLPERSEDHA